MSEASWYEASEDCITLYTPVAGVRSYTEKKLQGLGWRSVDEFATNLDCMHFERRTPKATHHVSAAEVDEILAAKCQPAHVSHVEPELEKTATERVRELRDMQAASCDCINDQYFRGLYNGLELALACMENRDPVYMGKPESPAHTVSTAKPALAGLQRLNDGSAICGSAHLLA